MRTLSVAERPQGGATARPAGRLVRRPLVHVVRRAAASRLGRWSTADAGRRCGARADCTTADRLNDRTVSDLQGSHRPQEALSGLLLRAPTRTHVRRMQEDAATQTDAEDRQTQAVSRGLVGVATMNAL